MTPRFTRQPNGSYRFETTQGRTFEATRNEAGFAGRQWELSEITLYGVADGRYNEMSQPIGEQYATRKEAAAAAEWFDRDFWTAYYEAQKEGSR